MKWNVSIISKPLTKGCNFQEVQSYRTEIWNDLIYTRQKGLNFNDQEHIKSVSDYSKGCSFMFNCLELYTQLYYSIYTVILECAAITHSS